MLKVRFQFFVGEVCEKLRFGSFVDFANAFYQLVFIHTHTPLQIIIYPVEVLLNLTNIDRPYIFSLENRPIAEMTPYNLNYHMAAELSGEPQYVAYTERVAF
jgi:hypothetical protein